MKHDMTSRHSNAAGICGRSCINSVFVALYNMFFIYPGASQFSTLVILVVPGSLQCSEFCRIVHSYVLGSCTMNINVFFLKERIGHCSTKCSNDSHVRFR